MKNSKHQKTSIVLPPIIKSFRNVSCSLVKEKLRLFDYIDAVTDTIGEVLETDFTKEFMKSGKIKKILGDVKRG